MNKLEICGRYDGQWESCEAEVSVYDNILDSRQIESRIKYLYYKYENEMGTDNLPSDLERELEEYKALEQVKEDTLGIYSRADWEGGVVFIRETYFDEYIRDLMSDIYCDEIERLPSIIRYSIDWKAVAKECMYDYSTVQYGKMDYFLQN